MNRIYDISKIIKIINGQFPDLIIESAGFLGAGYDSEAFLINHDHVFKFPKHQTASKNLRKEALALREIKNQLPLPIPDPEFLGVPAEIFDKYFMGYRKIDGVILTPEKFHSLGEQAKDEAAKDLASFLRALHNIKLSVEIDGLELELTEKYAEDYAKISKIAFLDLNENQRETVKKIYTDILKNKDLLNYRKCLAHCDLSACHILFDETTDKISGIIDFGDVSITDADYDFMYLLENSGEEFGRDFGLKVLEYYHHPDKNLMLKKADFYEFYWPFEQAIMGAEYGLEDWRHEGMEKIKNGKFGISTAY